MEEEEEETQGFQPDEEVQPESVTRKRKPPVAECPVELEQPQKTPKPKNAQPADKNDDRTTSAGGALDGDLKKDGNDKKVTDATIKTDDKDGELEKVDTSGNKLEEKDKIEKKEPEENQKESQVQKLEEKNTIEKKENEKNQGDEKESQVQESQNTQWFLD